MNSVFRTACDIGGDFMAPRNVTFGWQELRRQFSIWFREGERAECRYRILGTGQGIEEPFELVASVVMPDGFHVIHLVRLGG